MKQTTFLTFAVVSFFTMTVLSACNKIKEKARVNINLSSGDVDFTIPQITQTGATSLAQVNVAMNIDSIIKANNSQFSASNIKSVKINSCAIAMQDGDASNNFSALQSALVQLSSNNNSTLQTISEVTNNPDVENYNLTVPINSSVDLASYFNASSFTYNITGNARKTTSKAIQCKATFSYTVEVGL